MEIVKKLKIAIYGSAAKDINDKVKELARETGRQIALRNHVLITGACPGLPYEAVLGAKENNGKSIGFSPGLNLDDHVNRFGFPSEGFDELIFIPDNYEYKHIKAACLKYRNIPSVLESHAVITISGRCGTTNEFTLAHDFGKNIGVLIETGGMSEYFEKLVRVWNKPKGSQIIYEPNPEKLIKNLEEITTLDKTYPI